MKIINKPQYVIVLVVIVEVTVGLFEKLCQPKLSNEDVILPDEKAFPAQIIQ